jgi:phage terminase small subunit
MSKREHASGRRGEQAIEAFGAPARRLQRSAQRGAKPIGAPVVPKTLTAKQRRFIEEYCTDLNATGAAVRAAYSRRSASDIGYKNLRKVEIAQAITDWKQKLSARVETTRDEIAAELRKLGFANLLDYFHVTPDGAPVIDLSMITREQAAALTEIQVEDAKGKSPGKVRIKLGEKRQALVDLAKLLGHMTDKLKVEGSLDLVARTAKIAEDVRRMTDEERRE